MTGWISKFRLVFRSVPRAQLFLSFGIAFALAAIAVNTELFRVEAYFYDLRIRLKGSENPSSDIMLMPLGDLYDDNHTSIEAHLRALENLIAAKPKAIHYLNKFDSSEIETKPSIAERFVRLAQEANRNGIQVVLGTDVDLSGEVLAPYPLSMLPHAPSILHKDGTMFGEDKVMRRALLTIFNEPSLPLRAAYPNLGREELLQKAKEVRGAYFYEPAKSWHVLINYSGNTSIEQHRFPILHFKHAHDGIGVDQARGKIILVETLRKDAMNDYAYTPFSRVIYSHPRLVVYGSILDTLIKNNGIKAVSDGINALITFLLALSLAFIAITMRPSRGVFALISLSLGLFGISLILFHFAIWIPLVPPLLAMFFTYYLIVPYRAILEYKKRWEVQEKHDLLVQVEEMKGNFLSLMSHDLKTPVARIQGLAEMVLRQGKLIPQQEEEIRQIISSTESLDKFISKILNLTKVESNEIKINRKSKDINKILEQCVKKLEFQAKTKGITIEMDLYPLFPIHVDAALLIQVFTNIIDNAIKYSPEGSKIKISSKEIGDSIEVMVEDTGPGMNEEEKEQLFTKFFRGKSFVEDQDKGSGLGLYLSKYFIELHNGTIEAKSQSGSGSKFSVKLPISNL
jgi:signal transduction histidine kinase